MIVCAGPAWPGPTRSSKVKVVPASENTQPVATVDPLVKVPLPAMVRSNPDDEVRDPAEPADKTNWIALSDWLTAAGSTKSFSTVSVSWFTPKVKTISAEQVCAKSAAHGAFTLIVLALAMPARIVRKASCFKLSSDLLLNLVYRRD